ncbi:hypothetical protein [Rhodovastum atsumiense]|uniref:hypothetical protein n=1 Tax=Rhodovastum atsumiense TaxID=504468 RepID=UPI0038D0FC11
MSSAIGPAGPATGNATAGPGTGPIRRTVTRPPSRLSKRAASPCPIPKAPADLAREIDPAELAALERAGTPDPPPDAAEQACDCSLAPAVVTRPVTTTETAKPCRGRGTTVNPPNRFERHSIAPFDDGWQTLAELAEAPPSSATAAAARSPGTARPILASTAR